MHLFSRGRLLDGLYTLLQRDVLVVPLVLVTCSLSLSLVDLGTQPTMELKKKVFCYVGVLVPVDLSSRVCWPWAPADFRGHGYRRG